MTGSDLGDTAKYTEACGTRIGKSAMGGGSIGIFMGSALLAWYPDPYRFDFKGTVVPKALGVRYVINGLRSPVLWGSLVCGAYSGVECIMEQVRDESKASTYVNAATAGAVAGAIIGSMSKRLDVMSATALALGMAMGMVDYNGSTTVSDLEHAKVKWELSLPKKHVESTQVAALKDKYPEFKDL